MKKHLLTIAAAIGCLTVASAASAQTCTAFSGLIATKGGSVQGDSCQAGGSALAGACSNAETLNGAGVAIYELHIPDEASYTITVNTTAFVPWLGYIRGTCSSNTACIDDVTRSGPGEIFITHSAGDTPPGTYYLIVGGVDVDTPGCGSFTVNWRITPVELQSFSIE
ncbi:hypothetical protein [Dokdonella sp.]|uniref:hypothetical protein n=1 Tax=Dokdonella sp. TaxID=2291710 RepID=UPI001B1CAD80|nr:hypothetical protein [Dokdonella sp.]MBO9664320.1 hypothetical protein [Dokdonella sp.]